MIGQIIYGETCKGTLNYVFGKGGMRILGYGNTFSQNISPKFFESVLHFQGQRNATKNRYAHISLNLPHGEHLDDATFHKISKEYMDKMGYGKQPYVVVRHIDTKHEHVHILTTQSSENSSKLTALTIFLPMVFPQLYQKMAPSYKQQYESVALGSYLKHAERMHAPFEKSAKDYIAFFNAKGFYFEKGTDGLQVKSIYTEKKASFTLSKRTSLYLNSIPNLSQTLKEQQTVINGLVKYGRNNLKNLWAGHLMERGIYDKVAFMLTEEKVYPNLHSEMAQQHMDNGLRKSINEAFKRQSSIQQNRLLRKAVYAVSSFLGNRGKAQEEVFNGFKDEFTDYSKYKRRGLSL